MSATAVDWPTERRQLLKMFGAKMKAARRDANLTQKGLAERCRLSVSLISQIERGQYEPKLQVLMILADALGMTIGGLAGDMPAPKNRMPYPPEPASLAATKRRSASRRGGRRSGKR